MSHPVQYTPPGFIAVEGPLRVGKSSLAQILAERLGGVRIADVENNPFLGAFYAERPGAAFSTQLYFLMKRYQQWRELDRTTLGGRVVVSDYLFEKDKIFAYLNLNDAELELYNEYYELLAGELPIPDLVIYLQAKPETLRLRIARKNIEAENQISDEYLAAVVEAYEYFFHHYTSSDLLVVETSEMDFVHRSQDLENLLERVRQPVKGTQYFLPLGSRGGD